MDTVFSLKLPVTRWVYESGGLPHPLVFDFELVLQNQTTKDNLMKTIRMWWWITIPISMIYVCLIFYGQYLMKNRTRYEARKALILWNLFLAIFSIVSLIRCLPSIVYVLMTKHLDDALCYRNFGMPIVDLWFKFFGLSKLFELVDTIFIVIRKQKLIFLHWFHHTTVMIYVWYSIRDDSSTSAYFGSINSCVHALMYSYYALRAMKYNIPKFAQILLTTFQISQMVIGCYINYNVFQSKRRGMNCEITYSNIYWSIGMYAVYFILFVHYFLESYVLKKPGSGRKQTRMEHGEPISARDPSVSHQEHKKKE